MFVVGDDFHGQIWDIDSGVAFSGHVEVVVAEFRELDKESEQSLQIELGDGGVIESGMLTIAESNLVYDEQLLLVVR